MWRSWRRQHRNGSCWNIYKQQVTYPLDVLSPRDSNNVDLLLLNSFLRSNSESSCVLVVGDFNISALDWTDSPPVNIGGNATGRDNFCDLMGDNFLVQFVDGPTHIAGNRTWSCSVQLSWSNRRCFYTQPGSERISVRPLYYWFLDESKVSLSKTGTPQSLRF